MMNLEVLHRWECLPYEINHTGVIFSSINRFFRKRKIHFAKKHFKPTEVISSDFAEVWFRTTKMIRQLPGQR